MEMADSNHKFGHDWVQAVKTLKKKISISAPSWNLRGICVCIICCAGPLPFSAVVLMGFFSLIYWFIAYVCRRMYKQLDILKSTSTICLSTNY